MKTVRWPQNVQVEWGGGGSNRLGVELCVNYARTMRAKFFLGVKETSPRSKWFRPEQPSCIRARAARTLLSS